MNTPHPTSFESLGLAPSLLGILKKLNFSTPTPIQGKAIPIALQGRDVIGVAQTGTGKTLAFGLPLIQRLPDLKGQALILIPTRELALQVDEMLQKIGQTIGLRTTVLIGGTAMQPQLRGLRGNPHIIIATPGRLLDHVKQRTVDLAKIKAVVLDEADRMLDMGFAPDIKRVMDSIAKERQVLLFSATMPREILQLAQQYMKLPLQIEVAPAGTLADRVDQEFYMVRKEDKPRLLDTLIQQSAGTILIFSRTKHGAKRICRAINAMGVRASELHANRTLSQRREAMDGFKSGRYRILVATDIAARGIDVSNIGLVINYDIPDDPEDYVHRIGRTGRAGLAGKAITFIAPDQRNKVRDIERLTRTNVSVSQTPELAPARPALPPTPFEEQRQRGRGQSRPFMRSPRRGKPLITRETREGASHMSENDKLFDKRSHGRRPFQSASRGQGRGGPNRGGGPRRSRTRRSGGGRRFGNSR